jgi:hypothetical protein
VASGTRLSFHVAGEASARAYLPVETLGAEIVAIDGHGRPALLRHALGSGQTVLTTYPLEHMAARTAWVNPESTWRLYSALAEAAGVARPIRVDDPRVLVGRVRSGGSETALFVNCSNEQLVVAPIVAEGVELRLDAEALTVDPFGVVVIPCQGALPAQGARAVPQEVAAIWVNEGRDARE